MQQYIVSLWEHKEQHIHVNPDKRVFYYGRRIQNRYDEEALLRWVRINHYHGPIWFHEEIMFNTTLSSCFELQGNSLVFKGALPSFSPTDKFQPTYQSVNH